MHNFLFESALLDKNINLVAGVDEVGRGCLAGPMVVGAVIWDTSKILHLDNSQINEIRDSKLLTAKKRKELEEFIKQSCLSYSIEIITSQTLDSKGIGQCTQLGFYNAISKLAVKPQHILTDAFEIKKLTKDCQTNIISGDKKSITIGAASILAKVFRDELMIKQHQNPKYAMYGFDKHKGYGTKLHMDMLTKFGPSDIHRYSFAPIASMVKI